MTDTKQCPFCAERVKKQAIICRYCQRSLPSTTTESPERVKHEVIRKSKSFSLKNLNRQSKLALLFIVVSFTFFSVIANKYSSTDSNYSSSTKKSTTLTDKNNLSYKIRHPNAQSGDKFVIRGQEVRVGQTADSVFEKLGKSGVGPRKETDSEYGLIVEHQYDNYKLLMAREPKNQAFFVVWDIYE